MPHGRWLLVLAPKKDKFTKLSQLIVLSHAALMCKLLSEINEENMKKILVVAFVILRLFVRTVSAQDTY